ncbi:MAG: ABC transporter permease [Acidobacteriia bacterium]|nr:ABC transporter permease [Terriglobia bacterium]
MVERDLKNRYIGSAIGIIWSVIHPLVLLISYTFVFSVIIKHPLGPESGTTSFAIYLFCGILPWMMFQETLVRSSNVLVEHSNLITKTLFPAEILPVSVLIANLFNHLIGVSIFLGIILFYLQNLTIYVLLIPIYLFGLMIFSLGLSWIVSGIQVFLRDTAQVVIVILTFWFWFTPIFFDENQLSRVSSKLVFVMHFNPLAEVVIAYRKCLLIGEMPTWQGMVAIYGIALVTFIVGGIFFRYVKRSFADVL